MCFLSFKDILLKSSGDSISLVTALLMSPSFCSTAFSTKILKLSVYINIDCVSENLCKSYESGLSYGNYQPTLQSFTNTFKCFSQAENSMTVRAYMGGVLIQVWLKSIKK